MAFLSTGPFNWKLRILARVQSNSNDVFYGVKFFTTQEKMDSSSMLL